MNFGEAIELLKLGKTVRREDWENCLRLSATGAIMQFDELDPSDFREYVIEQSDALADDWEEC